MKAIELGDIDFPDFKPLEERDGYLPIRDHALIGDGASAALVGRDGSIAWMCIPRFDSSPLFAALLDRKRGGRFRIGVKQLIETRQQYIPDTGVIVTQLRSESGTLEIVDALVFQEGVHIASDTASERKELVRQIRCLEGEVEVLIELSPRGKARLEPRGVGYRVRCERFPDLELQYDATFEIRETAQSVWMSSGETHDMTLRWGQHSYLFRAEESERLLASTIRCWKRWMEELQYEGPRAPLVRRAAITLKMLDVFANGAIIAAPTSSLPEWIGGVRNWDYRYTWIRDAAFSVYALRRIGLDQEAWRFLAWVLDDVERASDDQPRIMYAVDRGKIPEEVEDDELEGYRGSAPVRWGNAASDQQQNDVYGEVLDCAYQWADNGGAIPPHLWDKLRPLADKAAKMWNQPDKGIWEVRNASQPFTYSAALCHVALSRAIRIVELTGNDGDVERWKKAMDEIREAILEEGWNEELGSITQQFGADKPALDASILTLPLRRVIEADHPKMLRTTEAIRQRLGEGKDLIYRYDPEESPDGLPGKEGAFLLCSFWLVELLCRQGKIDEAEEIFNSLCDRAGHLGLLSEQIDPANGEFLGNYPQAFSHVGLISAGYNIWHERKKKAGS
jgi:alpha,alpha-trehalase